MDSATKQLRLAAINRARAIDAEWHRAGELMRATQDFRSDVAWYWAGPEDDFTRAAFWQIVVQARCIVLEFLNDAIIGLIWDRGQPAVAYDASLALAILRRKWLLGDTSTKLQREIEARELEKFEAMLHTDFGKTTPWFLM